MRSKYWLRIVGTVLLVGIGGGIAMSLYMVLINSHTTLEDAVMMLPFQMVMMGIMANMIYGVTLFRTYVSVAVSFGCTRKEAWGGLQLVLLLGSAGLTAAAFLTSLLVPGDLSALVRSFLPAVFAVLVAFASVGQLFGAIFDRFGKLGVLVGICVGLFAGIGAATAMTFGFRTMESGVPGVMGAQEGKIILIACLVGGLLWLINLLVQRALLKRYAVHF